MISFPIKPVYSHVKYVFGCKSSRESTQEITWTQRTSAGLASRTSGLYVELRLSLTSAVLAVGVNLRFGTAWISKK